MIMQPESVRDLAKSNGLKVFPCAPGTKLPLTVHGFKADDKEIEMSFAKAPKGYNIALVAGSVSSGVVGIDCETEEVAWSLFNQREKVLSSTWCIKTPHGGVVVILRSVDTVPQRKLRIAGEDHPFDLCGEGGYFLIHGSIDHKLCDPKKSRCPHTGRSSYETISRTLSIREFMDLENTLLNRCEQLAWTTTTRKWPLVKEITGGVAEGSRNKAAFTMSRYLLFVMGMEETDALYALKVWNQRNKPPLFKDELEMVLRSARGSPRDRRRVQG
jgi:hypothetical protein